MIITSFVYCEDVTTDPGGKNMIIGPMQMFTPVGLPSNYSFIVSFGVYDMPKIGEKNIKIHFQSPHGEILTESSMTLPAFSTELSDSSRPSGVQLNVSFRNIVLNDIGEYKTVIQINNEILGHFPICVYYAN